MVYYTTLMENEYELRAELRIHFRCVSSQFVFKDGHALYARRGSVLTHVSQLHTACLYIVHSVQNLRFIHRVVARIENTMREHS